MRVHKVEITARPDRAAGDVEKTAGQFFQLCTAGGHPQRFDGFGTRRLAGEVQPGKLMLAELDLVALVIDGGVETCLAVAVAVKIAETDVPRVGHLDGPRKRLKGTDDAVAVESWRR